MSRKTPKLREVREAVDTFTFEAALLYFRMRVAATEYVAQGRHSPGRRSVLRTIGQHGPQAVPDMARVRAVSRQHVQKLVDELRTDGLVTTKPNPRDRRSKLVVLTRAGAKFLRELNAREADLFDFLAEGVSPTEFRRATRIVRLLRDRLESEEWQKLVSRYRGRQGSR